MCECCYPEGIVIVSTCLFCRLVIHIHNSKIMYQIRVTEGRVGSTYGLDLLPHGLDLHWNSRFFYGFFCQYLVHRSEGQGLLLPQSLFIFVFILGCSP